MIQNITTIIYTLILSLFLSLPLYLITSIKVLANDIDNNNNNIYNSNNINNNNNTNNTKNKIDNYNNINTNNIQNNINTNININTTTNNTNTNTNKNNINNYNSNNSNSNTNNNNITTDINNNTNTNHNNYNIHYTNAPRKVFGEWALFKTINDKKRLLCYIVSLPQKRYDNFNKRGQSFFSIIVEKDKTTEPEIFLSYGQIWKRGIKDAELDIVKRKFPIYTYEDKAWAYNKIDDKNIVEELKKSAIFTVNINFNNNKSLIDIYSLNGFNEAYNELIKGCR